MSKPIVVGYDGSGASERALRWAVDAAAARGLPVSVLTTWTPPSGFGGMGMAPAAGHAVENELAHDADAAVAKAVAHARTMQPTDHPMTITGEAVSGAAAQTLVARSAGATMVVLGSHGRHGLPGLLLGSVSRQVLAHAKCPVVVVRPPADELAKEIVVGVDGSPQSMVALDWAYDHASRTGLGLHVIHTWELPTVLAPTADPTFSTKEVLRDFRGTESRVAAEMMAGRSERWPEVHVDSEIRQGVAARHLVAASEHAALLVVGSRGHGGFVGLMLGSVSHFVGHHAHCPVAVVH